MFVIHFSLIILGVLRKWILTDGTQFKSYVITAYPAASLKHVCCPQVADLAPSAAPYFRPRSFFHTAQGQEIYQAQRNANG